MPVRELSDNNPDGTRFGQSTTDKIGFFGTAPIVKGAAIATGTDTATTQAAVNSVINRLQALGLVT